MSDGACVDGVSSDFFNPMVSQPVMKNAEQRIKNVIRFIIVVGSRFIGVIASAFLDCLQNAVCKKAASVWTARKWVNLISSIGSQKRSLASRISVKTSSSVGSVFPQRASIRVFIWGK